MKGKMGELLKFFRKREFKIIQARRTEPKQPKQLLLPTIFDL
jgi:hypothetical protein